METVNNNGYSLPCMDVGEQIKLAREALGWSQAALADRVGISQPAIKKIEGGETRQSKYLYLIAKALSMDIERLLESAPDIEPRAARVVPLPELSGPQDFPIHASAEGGEGQIIVSNDAVDYMPRPGPLAHVKGAYGLLITGTSMEPEYRPGDTALVNPNLPVVGGEAYIFYAEKSGEARATIKALRRATIDKWMVTQWNPPHGADSDFALLRKEWQWAHRVIGKYSRR